ncbi:hypothetical protein FRC01_005657 [Tulasnella sp. 417]|nr:hypothetical protein FRC01_005657 [Tulasnella sp. 417]
MEVRPDPTFPYDSAVIVQMSRGAPGLLPMEVIIEIVLFLLSDLQFNPLATSFSALRRLYDLRLVNSTWYRVIDSTPTFWTFIESSVPLRIVDVALKRSRTKSLSIRFRQNSLNTASSFMGKVVPCIGRWNVADLAAPAWEYLPQTPAPRLEELSFKSSSSYLDSTPITFPGEFISLQRLALDQVCLARPLPNLGPNLRFFSVRQLSKSDSGITYTEIHQFLLLHPSLIEIELKVSIWSRTSINTETWEDVSLPNLRHFTLLDPASNGLASIPLLQKISAPNCTSFELGVRYYTERFSALPQALEPFFVSVITTEEQDLELSIAKDPEFVLEIGRDGSKFKPGASWIPSKGLELGWVTDLLIRYRPNITHLKLLTPRTLSDDAVLKMFANLTTVTEFYAGSTMFGVWEALGRPAITAVEGSPSQWLLPALEKLVILDPVGIDYRRFISAIQARESAATKVHPVEHRPTRLKMVEYRGMPWVGTNRRWSELLGDRFVFESLKSS